MELIFFVIEAILTLQITKWLFRDKIKIIYTFNKRWKYELVEAFTVFSIVLVIFGVCSENNQMYFGGFILGFSQGIIETVLNYKKKIGQMNII